MIIITKLVNDWADTDYDEEVSQVMLGGGVYIAPLDTAKLCGSCTVLLNLVWDAENQKDIEKGSHPIPPRRSAHGP